MIEKVEGIVLNEKPYSETSKIINVITKEHGIVGILAKGALNLKSELRSVTAKLTYGYFYIYYKENKLSTLKSVDIIDSLKFIKKDLTKISFASYLIDLASQVMKQNNNELVYQLLVQSLLKINEGYDPLVITNILELKYLDYLGIMPILDSCSICGSKKDIITISSYRGGYVCKKCHTNEIIVNLKTIKLIRMFYYVNISNITNLNISVEIKNEINKFLSDYYDRYTGLYLKSKSFLKNIIKLNE